MSVPVLLWDFTRPPSGSECFRESCGCSLTAVNSKYENMVHINQTPSFLTLYISPAICVHLLSVHTEKSTAVQFLQGLGRSETFTFLKLASCCLQFNLHKLTRHSSSGPPCAYLALTRVQFLKRHAHMS